MKKYTREDLLKICEQAFVSEDKWGDRDSYYSQCKLGECYALLKDGCKFSIIYGGDLNTDENTIWLLIEAKGFSYFEDEEYGSKEQETFYLPTQKRLDEANGNDWY